MDRRFYQSLHDYFAARPGLRRVLALAARVLPGAVYVSYPCLLLWLLAAGSPLFLRSVLVPAAGFLGVTALRAGLNFPRPYEALGIPALVDKETKGKSFPSRHAACAAVIAVTAMRVLPPLGAALGIVALLIALTRVLTGVHFIRDTLAGLALGALVGWAGMFLLQG